MEWYGWVVIVVVFWAILHTYMDMQIKKKVDELEKELRSHKH
jgi:hypothetical protein